MQLVRSSSFLIFLALVFARAAAAPAPDAGQQLWTFLRGHGYGVLTIDSRSVNSQYVEAMIDGKNVELAIDTGSDRTRLRWNCARHLGLAIKDTGKPTYGVGGRIQGTEGIALVKSFKLMGYEINRTSTVDVLPNGVPAKSSDGLLGFDFLHLNAAILPVGAKFIFFKPGNAPPADVSSYMAALGYKAVALTHEPAGLIASGEMNGIPMTAIVDCGASFTIFSINFLNQKAKNSANYLGQVSTGLDRNSQPAYVFTPRSLSFGGIQLHPEQMLAQFSPALVVTKHDALLGYDLLAEHGAIIDLGSNTLWMK